MKKITFGLLALLMLSLSAKAQVTDYSKWMDGLDDNTFICQLSIPGAHDACSSSFSGILAGIYKAASQTQSKTVEQMLPLGVRLFDLRPCVSGSKLHINHGIASTTFDFDPVMKQICDFLDANPSEFCIVMIRHESEGDNNSSKFGDMLQTSLSNIKDHLVNFRPNLTVGEARGKILFISRDEYTAPVYGGRTADLADNRSNINDMLGGHCYGPETYRCAWWMQDHYEISDWAVKKQAISDMLGKSVALRGKFSYTWVVNQTSGYKGTTSSASAYQNNAKETNKHLQDLLATGNYGGPVGLVFMDYAGDDSNDMCGQSLTQALANHNFTYTPSKQGDEVKEGNNVYVAPRGKDMMWTARYMRKEGPSQPDGEDGSAAAQLDGVTPPASDWYATDFDDSSWGEMLFPIASPGTSAPYFKEWNGTYNTMWIRREFSVTYDDVMLGNFTFSTYHDDDYVVYVNGELLDSQEGWSSDFNNYRNVTIPTGKLHIGRNVLAIEVQQNWGGAYFDCGVLKKSKTSIPVHLSDNSWHTFVAPGKNVRVNANCEAYKVVSIVEGSTAYCKVEKIDVIPAGEAVLVRTSNAAGDYSFTATTTAASDCSDNLLKGTTNELKVEATGTVYTIAAPSGKPVGFYPAKRGTVLAPGEAYLDFTGSSTKPHSVLFWDEEIAGIEDIHITSDNTPVYNISGQRVNGLHKGINIVNGRKVVKF